MQTLYIPASYDVWLTGLKLHLGRHRGSKAELARYLAKLRGLTDASARVRVSQILSGAQILPADYFLDIAAWLQRRIDALNDPPVFMPLAPPVDAPPKPRPLRVPPPPPAQARAGK